MMKEKKKNLITKQKICVKYLLKNESSQNSGRVSYSYLFRSYLYLYIIRLGKVLLIFCDSEAGKCFTV